MLMEQRTNSTQRTDALLNSQQSRTLRDRKQILALLRKRPIHTIEFREIHGLISPAARIIELLRQCYNIRTDLIRAMSQDGRVHNNVAIYVLVSEPPAANQGKEIAA
jgi:3-polyprenyl-4-hydroxybenzoate decarboxylase